MRINKYIAASGVASRRKADELVAIGRVKVNGVVMKEAGYDVLDDDVVEVNGKFIQPETEKVYLLLNKPVGYITSTSDEMGRPTVFDLIDYGKDIRLFPVGRLDYNTSGLLILTNDGELANKLMHPGHEVEKRYRVRVKGTFTYAKKRILEEGVWLDGVKTAPAKVEIIKHDKNSSVVDITIHEGRNRQVRRMFSALGYRVQELERIAIGKIVIGRLATGRYRKLSDEEVRYLKSLK